MMAMHPSGSPDGEDAMNRLSEADRDPAPTRNETASARARVVDLATSEGDYSAAEIEFMGAMQEYRALQQADVPDLE